MRARHPLDSTKIACIYIRTPLAVAESSSTTATNSYKSLPAIMRTTSPAQAVQAFVTLGLLRSATEAEVQKAYRKLALLNHPDKIGHAEEKLKQINAAYELIQDEKLCNTSAAQHKKPSQQNKPRKSEAEQAEEFAAPGGVSKSLHNLIARYVWSQGIRGEKEPGYLRSTNFELRVLLVSIWMDPNQFNAVGKILDLTVKALVSKAATPDDARQLQQDLSYRELLRRTGLDEYLDTISKNLASHGWARMNKTWNYADEWKKASLRRDQRHLAGQGCLKDELC